MLIKLDRAIEEETELKAQRFVASPTFRELFEPELVYQKPNSNQSAISCLKVTQNSKKFTKPTESGNFSSNNPVLKLREYQTQISKLC